MKLLRQILISVIKSVASCFTVWRGWSEIILSVLLSGFVVVGYSFEKTDTYSMLYSTKANLLWTVLSFAGFYLLFRIVLGILFNHEKCFANWKTVDANKPKSRLLQSFEKHPFAYSFVLLLFIYTPFLIYNYPGIFMADTVVQIIQTYPEIGYSGLDYINEANQLSGDVFLNQHHPVAHTLLIHCFVEIGRHIGNLNVGIFLYSVLQMLVVITAYSLGVALLCKQKYINGKKTLLLFVLLLINPVMNNFIFVVTKDTIYGSFFLLEVLVLVPIVRNEAQKHHYIIAAVCMIGMIMFRNEAKYILVLTLVLLFFICRQNKRFFALSFVGVVLFSMLYFDVVMPALKATPGSKREALSIPFQQVALYVRCYENEVENEDAQIINKVLDYDSLKSKYNPMRSDPVKDTFKESASTKDLVDFFKVWAKLFAKHPGIYIRAVISNNYQYIYPSATKMVYYNYQSSLEWMDATNSHMSCFEELEFEQPARNALFSALDKFFTYCFYSLPLSIFTTTSTATWVMLGLIFYACKKKRTPEIFLPLCIAFLAVLAGPCNGYYVRYQYPIIVSLTFLFFVIISDQKRSVE